MEEKKSLTEIIEKLEILFSNLNSKYYNDELEKPVITVSPDTTKGALGWCTGWKAWKKSEDEKEGWYEINICADSLNRDGMEIAETLLHEMAHLKNVQEGIKDTSRGGYYHNKAYKKTAEEHGLKVSMMKKYGWAKTELTEEAKNYIDDCMGAGLKFGIYRSEPIKEKKERQNNSIKYICPCCGAIVRATKKVNIACVDCDQIMMEDN